MTMQLYGFWRSLAAFRVRVALRLKGLAFEEIPIDILSGEQFKPEYDAVNTERVVPTLVHQGRRIFQSLAIIEYLDDVEPGQPLLPTAPSDRAYVRGLALVTVADSHPLVTPRVRRHLVNTFGADAQVIEDWAKHWTMEGLAAYERLLTIRTPAPFAVGSEPGLADICMAGQVVGAHFLKLDLSSFPRLARLADHCFALPAFATSHPFEQPAYKASVGG